MSCPYCQQWQRHFNAAHAQRGAAMADLAAAKRETAEAWDSALIGTWGMSLVALLVFAFCILMFGATYL